MKEDLLDLNFLYQLAKNDEGYVNEVVRLYLANVPEGLKKLEKAISETNDFELIQRLAHAIKPSANIIRVLGMYDALVQIEAMARERSDKILMLSLVEKIAANFEKALPLILAEKLKPQLVG